MNIGNKTLKSCYDNFKLIKLLNQIYNATNKYKTKNFKDNYVTKINNK